MLSLQPPAHTDKSCTWKLSEHSTASRQTKLNCSWRIGVRYGTRLVEGQQQRNTRGRQERAFWPKKYILGSKGKGVRHQEICAALQFAPPSS